MAPASMMATNWRRGFHPLATALIAIHVGARKLAATMTSVKPTHPTKGTEGLVGKASHQSNSTAVDALSALSKTGEVSRRGRDHTNDPGRDTQF